MTWVITIEKTADSGRKDLFNHGGTERRMMNGPNNSALRTARLSGSTLSGLTTEGLVEVSAFRTAVITTISTAK